MIPYGRQEITEADIAEVEKVLRSDFLTQGPTVPRFEKSVANYCGASNAVAVNSATSSLHIACLALGLKGGDYLWTSPNTFVASANCGAYCGANIDFVDIDPNTYNMSVDSLSAKLEKAENEMLIFLEQNKSILSPSLLLQEKRMEKSITLYNQLYISLSDQLELAKIDEKDNTSPIVLLDEPSIIAYKSGRSLLENIFLLTFVLLAFFCSVECYRNSKDLFDL